MFQKVGASAFKKDLSNILALSEVLGTPHQQFRSIHIAGTNGKGSTAHMISAVLQAHGFKVGLYTSPHYRDFRERIKINGKYISQQKVVDFVKKNRSHFEEIKPSFFEISVALAFDFFAQEKVDFAVIETGLGGRLDSTNIITPLLSIITNISFDHTQFLGNTLPLIAGEKAGIIKTGVPVVIGETQPETEAVFRKAAKEHKSPIFFADAHYKAILLDSNLKGAHYKILRNDKIYLPDLFTDLTGPYQQKNLQTVLQALEMINTEIVPINEDNLRDALSRVQSLTNMLGRWQLLEQNPLILCDSAHNESGVKLAMEQLESMEWDTLHIVMGMVNDKDTEKILKLFPKNARYYFARPNIPRGLDASTLEQKASDLGMKGRTYHSVRNALRAAKRKATHRDLIFVGGSTFVVAEVV